MEKWNLSDHLAQERAEESIALREQAKDTEKMRIAQQIARYTDSEIREQVLQQLKSKAIDGDLTAIREYNRIYLPKNGMQSYVKFDLPPNVDEMTSTEFSRIILELMKAVSKGQMDLEQFDQLASSIKVLIDVKDTAEQQAEIDSLRELIINRNGNEGPIVDAVGKPKPRNLIPMADYKSKTPTNTVEITPSSAPNTGLGLGKEGYHRGVPGIKSTHGPYSKGGSNKTNDPFDEL